jgi:acetyl esterase
MSAFEDRLDPQVLAALQETQNDNSKDGTRVANPAVIHQDQTVRGPENAPDVLVRVYQLAERSEEPAPGLLYIHGGGMTGGSYEEFAEIIEEVVVETGAVVVSPEYRLAPENPFPAAPDDCYAVLKWLASDGHDLHIDKERIAVGGVSAGGCLAAAVALMARDKGGPGLCFQFLIIPNTDDRLITPSSQEIHDPRVFNSEGARMVWEAYLGDSRDDVSPYAAPARATDLSGLPPAYIYVEEQDPLRDEGIAYANRLMQAGVNTELHVWPGTFHGSHLEAPEAEVSKRAMAEQMATFKRVLGTK